MFTLTSYEVNNVFRRIFLCPPTSRATYLLCRRFVEMVLKKGAAVLEWCWNGVEVVLKYGAALMKWSFSLRC